MFRFLLAYSDEPRSVRHNNIDGSTTYSEFNKYDYLAQDAAGEWYWLDDFLFSVDNTSSLAGNRESMWQEIRMNLRTGAFGDPSDPETLIMFWEMMAGQHYPGVAEIRERLEKRDRSSLHRCRCSRCSRRFHRRHKHRCRRGQSRRACPTWRWRMQAAVL